MNELNTFKKIVRDIAINFRAGRAVTLKPSETVALEFEEALVLVEREQSRLRNVGRKIATGPCSLRAQRERERRAAQRAAKVAGIAQSA